MFYFEEIQHAAIRREEMAQERLSSSQAEQELDFQGLNTRSNIVLNQRF